MWIHFNGIFHYGPSVWGFPICGGNPISTLLLLAFRAERRFRSAAPFGQLDGNPSRPLDAEKHHANNQTNAHKCSG